MKKIVKYFRFILVSIFLIGCATTKNEKVVITGEYTWNQWQKAAGWTLYTADEYEPGDFLVQQISELCNSRDIRFLLFSGSWCHDSEEQLPKIYKLFDAANISLSKVKLYGVDRDKLEPTGIAENYVIEKVPTLILVSNDEEIGRIVELPITSWEEDIFKILVK